MEKSFKGVGYPDLSGPTTKKDTLYDYINVTVIIIVEVHICSISRFWELGHVLTYMIYIFNALYRQL